MARSDSLDPQCAALLAEIGERPGTPTVEQARAGHAVVSEKFGGVAPYVARVETVVVPAGLPAGSGDSRVPVRAAANHARAIVEAPAIAIRRYVPRDGASRAIVYLHGGGWVVGTLDTYDTLCRALALACDAQVFSVDYRLAPEARFPAQIEDSRRAFEFVRDRAARFGVDPRKLVLAGDSAGGHLAVNVARWVKRDDRMPPAALVLVYPVADRRMRGASVEQFGTGHYLTSELMQWYWQQFLGDDSPGADHPDVSPVLADDLAGLPPTLVITAGCDILRDEGEALAIAMRRRGVEADIERVAGQIHGFVRFRGRLDAAARALDSVAEAFGRWRL